MGMYKSNNMPDSVTVSQTNEVQRESSKIVFISILCDTYKYLSSAH